MIGWSASRMNWTSSSAASGSRAESGSLALTARYLGTLLTTVPPSSGMRARTAGVTSARMSTSTRPPSVRSASGTRAAESAAVAGSRSDGGCNSRTTRAAASSSSREPTFRCAGVRCAFAASRSTMPPGICGTRACGCLLCSWIPGDARRSGPTSAVSAAAPAGATLGCAAPSSAPASGGTGAGRLQAAFAPPLRPRHCQPAAGPPSSGAGTPTRQTPSSLPQRPFSGGAGSGCTTWVAQPAATTDVAVSSARKALGRLRRAGGGCAGSASPRGAAVPAATAVALKRTAPGQATGRALRRRPSIAAPERLRLSTRAGVKAGAWRRCVSVSARP